MQSVGYWEAWTLWWSGQKVDTMQMWGMPFLWWGRIGKLMQFGGGLIAVLDLIGFERLDGGTRRVARIFESFARWWRKDVLNTAICAFISIMAFSVYQLANHPKPGQNLFLSIVTVIVGTISVLVVNNLILVNIDKILRPLLVIFRAESATHPVRWFAFVMVTIGFSFDLLAS